jgi:hypothetical protein
MAQYRAWPSYRRNMSPSSVFRYGMGEPDGVARLDCEDFGGGMSCAPVEWDYYGTPEGSVLFLYLLKFRPVFPTQI